MRIEELGGLRDRAVCTSLLIKVACTFTVPDTSRTRKNGVLWRSISALVLWSLRSLVSLGDYITRVHCFHVALLGLKRSSSSYHTDLGHVHCRHLCSADRWVTRGVGKRLAWPDGQLMLLLGGHDLLGNYNIGRKTQTVSWYGFVLLMLNTTGVLLYLIRNEVQRARGGLINIHNHCRELGKMLTFWTLIGCL